MMDQIQAVSRPALMKEPQMLKGMSKSPLAQVLLSRHMSPKLPSMKPHMPKMGNIGRHENQPKIKPLASGLRAPSLSR